MKKKIRKALKLLLVVVFLCSTALMIRQYLSDWAAGDSYSDARALAMAEPAVVETIPVEETVAPTLPPKKIWVPEPVEEEDPYMEELKNIDLDALREVNEDVMGWILIPDSKVNYPMLHGEDNLFYLKRTWDLKRYAAGGIFLECMNSPDMTDFNTIIYGHNMANGSMFASLRQYADQEYYDQRPYVYIRTDDGVFRYEIFSSYRAKVESNTYGLSFNQKDTRVTFLETALENSVIETDVVPAISDRIITLSTCSGAGYNNRCVVHARLKMIQVEVTET